MKAIFRHGTVIEMSDYTPSGSNVSAGDVIVLGKSTGFAHSDIADGRLGALAVRGGVYDVAKATGGSEAIAKNTILYWDAGDQVVTTTPTDNALIGACDQAAGDNDPYVRIRHAEPAPEPGTS